MAPVSRAADARPWLLLSTVLVAGPNQWSARTDEPAFSVYDAAATASTHTFYGVLVLLDAQVGHDSDVARGAGPYRMRTKTCASRLFFCGQY